MQGKDQKLGYMKVKGRKDVKTIFCDNICEDSQKEGKSIYCRLSYWWVQALLKKEDGL